MCGGGGRRTVQELPCPQRCLRGRILPEGVTANRPGTARPQGAGGMGRAQLPRKAQQEPPEQVGKRAQESRGGQEVLQALRALERKGYRDGRGALSGDGAALAWESGIWSRRAPRGGRCQNDSDEGGLRVVWVVRWGRPAGEHSSSNGRGPAWGWTRRAGFQKRGCQAWRGVSGPCGGPGPSRDVDSGGEAAHAAPGRPRTPVGPSGVLLAP